MICVNVLLVFSIHLPCTGDVIADVDIKIVIDVSLFSTSNITNLELRRRKTCLKGKVTTVDRSIIMLLLLDGAIIYVLSSFPSCKLGY